MPATSAASRYRPIITAVALGALALLVCGRDLDRAPVYIYHDEAIYALNAHSILTTGRDLQGLRLPLFFHTFAWVPPIAIYARALTFIWAPVSTVTTRFPGVVFLAIDVILTYLVGRRLFRHEGLALLGAVFVMLTPSHMMHARLATDHICSLPFFMLFVLFMIGYMDHGTPRSLGAATLCLSLGIYGYNGGMTQAPVFLVLTGLLLFFTLRVRTMRPYVVAAAGVALALLPLVLWLIAHPEQPRDQLRSYAVSAPGVGAAPAGAGTALLSALVARLDAYYNFFNPSMLFFRGGQSLLDSTREVGVFLLPMAVLLPVGVHHILVRHRHLADRFVLLGFFVAPFSALIVPEANASRAFAMVPLAALIATRGVQSLLRSASMVWRGLAIVLLIATVAQFQMFYRDYLGQYRERSSSWFEGNRDGAFEALIARADGNHAARMHVSGDIPLARYSWQFYLLEHRRPDLKDRFTYCDEAFDFAAAPEGSVFLAPFNQGQPSAFDRSPMLKRVAVIENADRHPAFAVYEK